MYRRRSAMQIMSTCWSGINFVLESCELTWNFVQMSFPLHYINCHVTHPLIDWPSNYFSLIISHFYFRNSVKHLIVLIPVPKVCLFLIYHILLFSLLSFSFCLSYHIFRSLLWATWTLLLAFLCEILVSPSCSSIGIK